MQHTITNIKSLARPSVLQDKTNSHIFLDLSMSYSFKSKFSKLLSVICAQMLISEASHTTLSQTSIHMLHNQGYYIDLMLLLLSIITNLCNSLILQTVFLSPLFYLAITY